MEPKVTLQLNVQSLNIVLAGLAKLPLEQSLDTFNIIRDQANAQLQQPRPEGPMSDKLVS